MSKPRGRFFSNFVCFSKSPNFMQVLTGDWLTRLLSSSNVLFMFCLCLRKIYAVTFESFGTEWWKTLYLFICYQNSKVKKHLMYQHYWKVSSTYLVNSTSVPPIHSTTTFYLLQGFSFFSKVRSTQYSVAREQYDTSNPTFHDI